VRGFSIAISKQDAHGGTKITRFSNANFVYNPNLLTAQPQAGL